ncbi:MAG: nucleoside triphosphate pyrophosphohydrolase [Deltaproteobacteria bacterium]|nr:nucleoside triphosphate pyrophosphohydrolase [Deltaproteobacteria bacterium]
MTDNLNEIKGLEKLRMIIGRLRAPDGCPWDRRQKKEDIGRYLLEEAYEVMDALNEDSPSHQKEELGDLLFQILFIAHLAEEAGEFAIDDVMDDIAEKMIRRHPHVFGAVKVSSVEEVKANWEDIKQNIEKKERPPAGLLGKIPRSWPALLKAQKITENASKVGFDWENIDGVLDKVEEELNELKSALKGISHKDITEEIGDVLFSIVNLCRFSNVDAEEALNASAQKFIRRFAYMERTVGGQGKTISGLSPDQMDELWNRAKKLEEEVP